MKSGSLFSGSGTCELAAVLSGIEPVWASEIEKFPVEVTKTRFPYMKHLGDIRKINGAEIEPVDIITFGSPCTDVSAAGKREGLKGTQSSLFFEAIRIIREMRKETNNEYPRFIMWENVPGAFSSDKGYDFRTVLEEIAESEIPMPDNNRWANAGMVELPYRQIAWRVLDAQHWGVPQRRKRIFLVADFRGKCAGEVLFKPESMSGGFAESRETGKRITRNSERSPDNTGGQRQSCIVYGLCPDNSGTAGGVSCEEEKVSTLTATKKLAVMIPFGEAGFSGYPENKTVVRRLTPTECARLQGFPDWWAKDIPHSDTAAYKMWGNGMALPCVLYIIQNMAEVYRNAGCELNENSMNCLDVPGIARAVLEQR